MGKLVVLEAGQSILIQKGARIRYSNPFEEECEYLAICLPAFSMDLVNREDKVFKITPFREGKIILRRIFY